MKFGRTCSFSARYMVLSIFTRYNIMLVYFLLFEDVGGLIYSFTILFYTGMNQSSSEASSLSVTPSKKLSPFSRSSLNCVHPPCLYVNNLGKQWTNLMVCQNFYSMIQSHFIVYNVIISCSIPKGTLDQLIFLSSVYSLYFHLRPLKIPLS